MEKQDFIPCDICGEDSYDDVSEECECCGNEMEHFCPPCGALIHTIDVNADCFHGNPKAFWQGLADYCLKFRDLEIRHSSNQE